MLLLILNMNKRMTPQMIRNVSPALVTLSVHHMYYPSATYFPMKLRNSVKQSFRALTVKGDSLLKKSTNTRFNKVLVLLKSGYEYVETHLRIFYLGLNKVTGFYMGVGVFLGIVCAVIIGLFM